MIRTSVLIALALLAGCDRPVQVPHPTSNSAFDNAIVERSIIQPEIAAANPPEPEPTAAPSPPPTSVTVPFDRGVALTDATQASLDRFIADVPTSARLVVRGHSDSPGSDTANLTQSRKRADAVRDYLVAHGIAAEQVAVVALGERRPVAPNANLDGSDDPAGRARNRRVEVELLPEQPLPATSQLSEPAD